MRVFSDALLRSGTTVAFHTPQTYSKVTVTLSLGMTDAKPSSSSTVPVTVSMVGERVNVSDSGDA